MMNRIVFAVFLLLFGEATECLAQNFGLGASGLYNFQTESVGAGLRGVVFPNKVISISPQVSYYFPFNKVHEITGGLSLEAKFARTRLFNIYGLAHGGYNRWISYDASALPDAQPNNWNFEGGIGVSGQKCLRFFAEYRYNLKFRETHLNAGLLYIFGCKGRSGKFKSKSKKADDCPAFR
jgi:hypothetical protein